MELLAHARRTIRDEGVLSVAAKAQRFARQRATSSYARARLRAATREAQTVEQAIELAFTFNVGDLTIKPIQWRPEITGLLAVLEERRPQTVLEIGTCLGGTLFLLTRVASDDALILSVDLLHGLYGGGYSPAKEPLYRGFARAQQRIELVRASSQEESTRDRVQELLGGRTIDFLFIDGDHRYEGVKRDFELYSPLVSANGLIGFHDIVEGPESSVGGVPRLWAELKASAGDVREIVADRNQGSGGIGLIEKSALAVPAA